MDYVIQYLKNPMKIGVFNFQMTINLGEMGNLYSYLLEHMKSRQLKANIRSELKKIQNKEDYNLFTNCLGDFSNAVYTMLALKNCPTEIKQLYAYQAEERRYDDTESYEEVDIEYVFEEPIPKIFSPTVLYDFNDVLSIEILSPMENETKDVWGTFTDWGEISLDISSIKKEGSDFFLKFLKNIPAIANTLVLHKDPTETHSSRYIFSPYALAVRLWIEKEASKSVPKDLREFLTNSSKYYTLAEWRTSIILSAITTESLLADLYEEEYCESTPNKATLGELFELTMKKVEFPPDIVDAITMTNNARIAAVHRSRFPVSDREANNALFGATNFTVWYFTEYQHRRQ